MSIAISGVFVAAVVAFNVYATRLCIAHEPDARRRLAQLALTWLVPFVGAALVALAHRSSTTRGDPALDYTRPVDDAGVTVLAADTHHG